MNSILDQIGLLLAETQRVNAALWLQLPVTAGPLSIFLLRSLDQTTATFRTLLTSQGRRVLTWILGFGQAIFFLAAFSGLLAELDQPLNIVAFAAGYGTGAFLGISVDRWIAPGFSIIRVVSHGKGAALVKSLRAEGEGVTELAGRGLEGTVSVLLCTVRRRRVFEIRKLLLKIDPRAFITAENIRVLQGGWLKS